MAYHCCFVHLHCKTFGSLRLGNRSELLPILEDLASIREEHLIVDVFLLDGAKVNTMLQSDVAKTFNDYAEQVSLPYTFSNVNNVSRSFTMWD